MTFDASPAACGARVSRHGWHKTCEHKSTMRTQYSGILDTRDLEKRRAELQDLADALNEAQTALADADDNADHNALVQAVDDARSEFGDDEAAELKELDILEHEVPEWCDGNLLVPVGEFTDYVRELLDDIGDLPKGLPSYIVINWDATAANLKADYGEVDFQGETYLYRNC